MALDNNFVRITFLYWYKIFATLPFRLHGTDRVRINSFGLCSADYRFSQILLATLFTLGYLGPTQWSDICAAIWSRFGPTNATSCFEKANFINFHFLFLWTELAFTTGNAMFSISTAETVSNSVVVNANNIFLFKGFIFFFFCFFNFYYAELC